MNEKLDNFSKVLVATSAINYLANTLWEVNNQTKTTLHLYPAEKHIFEHGIKYKDEVLAETVKKLGQIMEELGECLNSCDASCEIDNRVTTPAFDIVLRGKDSVEE